MNGGGALPFGHVLQEYVIEGLVGEGGFGIVYLARDTRLGRNVALKEYMPANLATRGSNHTVSVRSERHRETFDLGLRSFVNEAQLLASFDHASLVKVYRFWEENGTAYMVMPFYQGPTLKKWLGQLGKPPDERWLLALLSPMIDALEQLHHDHCYHRDIAPDNILLLPVQGTLAGPEALTVRPLLLDFGAARRVIGDMTHALTVILKPGYAPIEQYADSAAMKQGPWTDVYALCAVLYACVTGRAPVPSVSRIIKDDMVPAAEAGMGRYSPMFLEAIDAGLAVRPDTRPQSMVALRELFAATSHGGVHAPLAAASSRPSMSDATVVVPPAPVAAAREAGARIDPSMTTREASEQTIVAPRARPSAPSASASPASAVRTGAPTRPLRLALSVLAAAMLAAGSWWWLSTKNGSPPLPPAAQGGPTAPQAALADAASPALPVSAASPVAAPVATVPVEAPEFTVLGALQDIVDRSDSRIAVTVSADKSTVTIDKDLLRFRVRSSESGYLYLFSGGTDKSELYALFPNPLDSNNRIEAGRDVVLPSKAWSIVASGPPGTNHIVALVSRQARDFAAPGPVRKGDAIPELDLQTARQLWIQRDAGAGGISPFIGKARCDSPPCDETYGATLLEISVVAAPQRGGR